MSYSSPLTFPFTEGGYSQPTAPLTFSFGAVADEQYLFPSAIEGAVGEPSVINYLSPAFPDGIFEEAFGTPQVSTTVIVRPRGLGPSRFGSARATRFIELEFGAGGFVPPTAPIVLDFNATGDRALLLNGFRSTVFGTGHVENAIKEARPAGILSLAFGSHTAWLAQQIAGATGWDSQLFGTAEAYNNTPQVYPGGIAPPPQTGSDALRQLPTPFVAYRIRSLSPGGIPVPTAQIPTTHVIAADIQYVDLAGRGPNPWATGTARVEYAVRNITPPFISSNIFGTHNVARIQVAAPGGWESSFVSSNHELDINLQRIFHTTGAADPAEYGTTHVRNQFEVLAPQGWLSQSINFPVVFNLDQYLFVQPYMGTNSDPTQWPNFYPLVENRTRVLGPGSWQSSRFSVIGNIVENTAAPLLPSGLDATLWGPETFIAFRIREMFPAGWDGFYSSQYAVVYNTAAVLTPQGWASSAVGTPNPVLNLNRTVAHVLPYGGESVGTAFVAFRVRTVSPSLFYDVPSGFPEVRLNPYPIDASGIAPPQFGGHVVEERFTIVAPRSTNVFSIPRVGEPFVENRNKTIAVSPSDQALYGRARIFNYDTYLTVSAGDLAAWGAHLIQFRTRTIASAPISVPVFVATHQIRNDIPDPPALQRVEPRGVFIGDEDLPGIVPSPVTRLATIYPGGFSLTAYGAPTLTRNTLEVRPGIFNLDQVGVPSLNATQYTYPQSIPLSVTAPSQGTSDLNLARPRVSPHTIYAPSGDQATSQARSNHLTPDTPQVIGWPQGSGIWSAGGGWPWFGRPDISNRHRVIGPVPTHFTGASSRFADPVLTLRRQFVYPGTIRSLRFGLVVFLGVPQYVVFAGARGGIASTNVFGGCVVAPPVDLTEYVRPGGFSATLWGAPRVELFNRVVAPQGIPHRGNPQQGLTNPWGTALVGFPRTYVWGGYDLTLWGRTWVSHKNRELPTQGWDSTTLGSDDLGSFADRMRVRRRNPEGSIAGIGPLSVVGTPDISHGVRVVYARGTLGYNAGRPAVKASAVVLPAGWDSLVVGDIDRWEAGKIKPYGDDLGVMGTPRMRHSIAPSGMDSSAVAEPRFAVPIYVAGMPEIGFAGPSLSDPFGCTNRVVAPAPIISQQNVPQPVVA